MPCYDSRDSTYPTEEINRLQRIEAALCAVIRKHGVEMVVDSLDKESGVRPEAIQSWWSAHLREDARRHAEKNAERQNKILSAKAMAKLTAAELSALLKTKNKF